MDVPAERKHVEVLSVPVVDHAQILGAQHAVNLVAYHSQDCQASGRYAHAPGKVRCR